MMSDKPGDRVVVVTGASSGIGRAIALKLAGNGGHMCLVARRREALEAVARQVCLQGAHPHVCPTDFTCDEDLQSLTAHVSDRFGKLDALVLCGGAMVHGSVEKASLVNLDLQYNSNLRSHYTLTKLMLPLLRTAQGQVVFLNSSAALHSSAGSGQYSAMQHALRAIADTLRDEVNPDGVRVLSVYPGRTATPRMAALFEEEGRPYRPELLMQPEDVAMMVNSALMLPRTAEVTDICMRPMRKSY